jgi:hypothetical protein
MGMHLGKQMMGHGHGHKPCCTLGHGHMPMPAHMRFFPFILIIPITMAVSAVIGLLLTCRLVKAMETMAMTKALDDMEDHLSDGERADLELRIRENLFR